MPPFLIRLLISTLVILHLAVVALAMLGHRGASFLHDDVLSFAAPYTALGNWKADTNRMPIASSNGLAEIVRIELHQRDTGDGVWIPLVPHEQPHGVSAQLTVDRRHRLEQFWLHQLSSLLVYENDEGAGRMLMAVLTNEMLDRATRFDKTRVDKIRVTVAPRLSQQQYIEVHASDDSNGFPESLQPQVAYLASVIDLGDGDLSLLRQTEARRASKTVAPLKPTSPKTGSQP